MRDMMNAVVSHLLETDEIFDDYLTREMVYLKSMDEGECIGGIGYDTSDHTGFTPHHIFCVYSHTRVIMSIEEAIEVVESAMRIKTL